MKDISWEWIGSSKPDDRGGVAVFSIGGKELEVEFCLFQDANSVFKILKEAYILGKEVGVHEVCVVFRKACDEACPTER